MVALDEVGKIFRNISVIPQSPTSHFLQNKQRIYHSYITSIFKLERCCLPFCVQHRELGNPGNFPRCKMQLRSLPETELFFPVTSLHHQTSLITWLFLSNKKAQNWNGEVPRSRGNGVYKRQLAFQFQTWMKAFIYDLLMYTNES